MKVLRELRSWLGRPGPSRTRLRVETLEDRLTPVSNTFTNTELLAVTTSGQPLRDLQNVVAAFDLSGSIDLSRSNVVLSSGTETLLQVGLTSFANPAFVQQKLAGTGLYTSVSPDFVYSGVGDLREHAPNDPQFGQQYYQTIINTPTAWDTTVGASNVVVAILDDGVSLVHPDLRNNVWTNTAEVAGDGVDNDGNGFTDDVNGWNFVANNNNVNPTDPIADSHGTEVAGILAAQIDNAAGIAGVAGGVRFMPLKVVDAGGGTTSLTLARAIGYAVQNGAKIINTSINVDPFADDPTYLAAVGLAYDRGLLLVNSAGNMNAGNPARLKIDEALFVAASDRNDVKTPYSNYGSGVDITAPGGTSDDSLLTTIPVSGYAGAFGTSMAAPMVAGVAALVWSAFPNYTRDQVAAAVLANADTILAKNPTYENQLGDGRLDAARAVSGAKIVTRLGKLTGLPAEGAAAPATLGSFDLRLQSPLDPATVTSSNFELRWAGPDNLFGTADDQLLPMEINDGRDYKIGTNDLVFAVNSPLQRGLYRFTAKSGGLRDPFGTAVDGDGNGTAGGNLVRNFGVAYQVSGVVYLDPQNVGTYAATDPGVAGVRVFADANGNGQLDQFGYVQHVGEAIPDAGPPAVATVTVTNPATVPGGMTVLVELVHPNTAELTVVLVAPDGTRVTLLDHRPLASLAPGGNGNYDLYFADGGPESSSATDTETTYHLNPADPLAGLIGHGGTGDWRVEVTDTVAGNAGILTAATLLFPAEPTAVTDGSGFFAFSGLSAGQFPVYVVPPPGYQFAAGGGGPVVVDTTRPNVPPVTVGLLPTAGVVGRVLLDTTKPVAGATVFVDANGNDVPDGGEPAATTDANGYYLLPGLANGAYPITVAVPAGFQTPAGTDRQSVALTPDAPLALETDFTLQRDTQPAVVTVVPVSPALRNDAIQEIDFTLSEPLPNLIVASLSLTRDGVPVSLDGTTLIHVGLRYSLLGLGDRTAATGTYAFGVDAPAPAGEPARRPAVATTTWTVDAAAPVVGLDGIYENNSLVGVTVSADKPISGLDVSDFAAFDGNDQPVSILTSTLDIAADGRSAVLRFPAAVARLSSVRIQLNGPTSGIVDAAGNAFLGTPGLSFQRPAGQTNDPPAVRRTVIGADAGGSPTVRVIDTATGTTLTTFLAFEAGFTGGVRVAVSDVNGDGVDDIIAAAGPGGGPRVRIFDGVTFNVLADFTAFEDTFTGGLFVSVGDLNADGVPDLVLSPDVGGGPRVRILNGRTLGVVADFFGIDDANFRGGVRTAVGDINGDGAPDVLVAAGSGGGPRVAGFDGTTIASGDPQKLFNDFFAFDPSLRNGVYLAAGTIDADKFADLVIGAGPGGGPRVLVLSGQVLSTTGEMSSIADFFSGDPTSRAGVRVAVKASQTLGSTTDLFTADGQGGTSQIRQYAGADLTGGDPPTLADFGAFDGLPETFSGAFVG